MRANVVKNVQPPRVNSSSALSSKLPWKLPWKKTIQMKIANMSSRCLWLATWAALGAFMLVHTAQAQRTLPDSGLIKEFTTDNPEPKFKAGPPLPLFNTPPFAPRRPPGLPTPNPPPKLRILPPMGDIPIAHPAGNADPTEIPQDSFEVPNVAGPKPQQSEDKRTPQPGNTHPKTDGIQNTYDIAGAVQYSSAAGVVRDHASFSEGLEVFGIIGLVTLLATTLLVVGRQMAKKISKEYTQEKYGVAGDRVPLVSTTGNRPTVYGAADLETELL